MTKDLVRKISSELSKGIDSEAQVLYLLVQTRKLRKSNSKNPKTFVDFYRDWACHIELTHSGAVKIFLDRFESLVKSNLTAHEIARNFIDQFPSFFKLEELKKELRDFFGSKGIKTELTDNSTKWYTFVKYLLAMLKDCSIKRLNPTSEKIVELNLEVDNNSNAKFKFRLRGRKDCPVCKLKWK